MAGPIMHNDFFSKCIYRSNLNKNSINPNVNNCNIFAQGHDLLLYIELYNFFKNRNISLILSNHKFREFVYNYLKISFENNSLYENENVKLFLYGYISHHILDSYFHPFIMQYCEDYLPVKNKKWLHGTIETLCDTYFIKNNLHFQPSKYKIYKDFTFKKVSNINFIKNIDKAMLLTYDFNNMGKKFNLSFNTISNYMHLYRYDPNGFKKKLAKITEPIINLGAEDFFYDENKLPMLEKFMNNQHKEWVNIWTKNTDKKLMFNTCLSDEYKKSMKIMIEIINEIENMINSNIISFQKIEKLIPNRSAITGLECGKKLSFIKYK